MVCLVAGCAGGGRDGGGSTGGHGGAGAGGGASGSTGGRGGGGTLTDWPNAANVGLLVQTTQTLPGDSINDGAWFAKHGFPGSGSEADPYRVDRVRFTGRIGLGNGSSDLRGRYVRFTNCRFEGNPDNPTPGGSAFLWGYDSGPFFLVEDSTLGPAGELDPQGGTPPSVGGTDKGIFSYVAFQVRRSNIYGANVIVGFETERDEGAIVIEDNYLHDIWSCCDDHTDIINGNFHASHVTVRHNTLDGIRTGPTFVTNGIGIYDDPVNSGAGIIEDWTIDHNYFDRSATMILSTDSTARFLDPFVLTDNVFTARFTNGRVFGRTPSRQSGNVDQNGAPLKF